MKAVILAAGMGTRMGKYTEGLPKGMMPFNGKPLIQWQIERLRSAGVSDINIVTGYQASAISFPNVTLHHNPNYASTNMVESLMCAREVLNEDVLVTYADIIYDLKLARLMLDCYHDVGVAVDESWRDYWMLRYGTTETDLETLSVDQSGRINELGRPVSCSDGIRHRYIGLIKFSKVGIGHAIEIYDKKKVRSEGWVQSGNPFAKGYMTDLLHELIINGNAVYPVVTQNGWLEFDTERDRELSTRALAIRGNEGVLL